MREFSSHFGLRLDSSPGAYSIYAARKNGKRYKDYPLAGPEAIRPLHQPQIIHARAAAEQRARSLPPLPLQAELLGREDSIEESEQILNLLLPLLSSSLLMDQTHFLYSENQK